VQESIYAFQYDIEHNQKLTKIKGDPLSFFMGILSKGQPYNAPAGYINPIEKERKIYFERKKREKQERDEREKQLIELEFEEWYLTLTNTEKLKFDDESVAILGPNVKIGRNKENAKKYFIENERPIIAENIKL